MHRRRDGGGEGTRDFRLPLGGEPWATVMGSQHAQICPTKETVVVTVVICYVQLERKAPLPLGPLHVMLVIVVWWGVSVGTLGTLQSLASFALLTCHWGQFYMCVGLMLVHVAKLR